MLLTGLLERAGSDTTPAGLLAAAAAAAGVGALASTGVGAALIRRFRRHGVTEDVSVPDSERLDALRRAKRGTPTMGGLMIIGGVLAAALLCAPPRPEVALTCGVLLAFGGLGFVDDLLKLRRGAAGVGRVLNRRTKLAVEIALGLAAAAYIWRAVPAGAAAPGALVLPFGAGAVDLGAGYVLVGGLLIALTANAVNLTDGLDGLAGGCALAAALVPPAAAVLGAARPAGAWFDPGVAASAAVLCGGLAGALVGFLRYNRHPARIFMGDTGALAIGGLLGVVVLVMKLEVLYLLFGVVFLLEAASVALQVGWFKLTRRRIFRCAPFHHHLEFGGWTETGVVRCFWAAAFVAALAAVVLVPFWVEG